MRKSVFLQRTISFSVHLIAATLLKQWANRTPEHFLYHLGLSGLGPTRDYRRQSDREEHLILLDSTYVF